MNTFLLKRTMKNDTSHLEKVQSNSDKRNYGYKKRFHSSDFMQVEFSTLIGQLIKETMDKRNSFLTAL